jgi:membrane protease subunit HflK
LIRRIRAAGDASRFAAVAAEYNKVPQVTSTRVYLEAMEAILPKLKKLIVDVNSNLDLSMIGRQENSAPAATPDGASQR